ncbi:MAG: ABC transporter permease [Rikenellaceae bacterium]|nr:ABC transporter permease [Rikenellaceae bacterium]
MKKIFKVIYRELGLVRHNRTFSALALGLPILAIVYFLLLFKTGVPTNLPIAVVDLDNSSLSKQFTRMIDAVPSVSIASMPKSTEEAEEMIRKGEIDAMLIIPREAEKDIYGNKPVTVPVFISGLNITKNGLIQRDLSTAIISFSTGIQVQTLVSQGMSEAQAYQAAMPINFERHILFNPYSSYSYYLLPIFFPMMMLIFILLTAVFTFGSEFKNGTAKEWLETAGGNIYYAFAGKLFPYLISFTILFVVADIVLFKYIGIPLRGNRTLILIANVLFVMAYQSLGVLIVVISAGSLRRSLSVGGGYSVFAFTLSGYTFPLMAMNPLLQVLSYIFPMTYYMRIFVDQAVRGAPAFDTADQLVYFMIFILLPLLLLPRLRKMCTDNKYWGRM